MAAPHRAIDDAGIERPGIDRLIDLACLAAAQIHATGPTEAKLRWVTDTARSMTAADCAGYADFTDGRTSISAAAGATVDELTFMASNHLADMVRAAINSEEPCDEAASPVLDGPHRATAGPGGSRPTGGSPTAGWASQMDTPVLSADGGLHGALILAHRQPDYFNERDMASVQALAAHLGVALDNLATVTRLAELEATQREAVHQLQFAVLPPAPSVEGVELGRYYLAADPNSPTGGDLYDWLALPNGDLHVAVVDVLGKGVGATKDALAITHALRLLVLDGCPLADLVARADGLVTVQNPDLVATVLVARYSPATGRLRLAGGGHPPALIVTPEGVVREVDAPGIAIGWPGAGSISLATVELDRSDTAILYTDGLVEATKDITVGLETLALAASEMATYPAAQLARALVERALAGAERRDDTLAVVIRRRLPPATEGGYRLGPFEHRFSPNLAAVSLARHLLADWMERQPIDPGAIDDVLLCASELCANAVKAATGAPGSLILRSMAVGDAIIIETEDDGPGFTGKMPPDEDTVPQSDLEQGRGLYLVRALSDELIVDYRDGRTIVRAIKRAVLGARP
jgi:sigma-B regulation protein RsbU (phosphoserine phosphatase)